MEIERPRQQRESTVRPTRLDLGPAPLPPDWSDIEAQSQSQIAQDGAQELLRQRQDSGELRAQEVGSIA